MLRETAFGFMSVRGIYRVEFVNAIGDSTTMSWRANSIQHAVQLFREAAERGDFSDWQDRHYKGEPITMKGRIEIREETEHYLFNAIVDFEDVEITFKGIKR